MIGRSFIFGIFLSLPIRCRSISISPREIKSAGQLPSEHIHRGYMRVDNAISNSFMHLMVSATSGLLYFFFIIP